MENSFVILHVSISHREKRCSKRFFVLVVPDELLLHCLYADCEDAVLRC